MTGRGCTYRVWVSSGYLDLISSQRRVLYSEFGRAKRGLPPRHLLPKVERCRNGNAIGLDLGVRDQFASSNGVKLRYSVPISDRLRRLQHFLSRTKPGLRNRENLLLRVRKEYEKQNNKTDVINKVAHYVTTHYEKV